MLSQPMPQITPLSTLNLHSLSQSFARLDHYFQARFRNRFGPVCRQLARFIHPGGTVLDIGANHGKFAKNFAQAQGGNCTVLCFEPLEYNYTLLERVVRRHRNVRVLRTALADHVGTADFYIPVRPSRRISPGAAHMGDEKNADTFGTSTARTVAKTTVPLDTLDAVVARETAASPGLHVDLMKVDVQGAEPLVIEGGRQTLAAHKPAIWCELCQGSTGPLGLTVHDSISRLAALGYQMFTLDIAAGTVTPTEFTPAIRDYLFIHPQGRKPL